MNKNEVALVKALGDLEASIAGLCRTVASNYGETYTKDVVAKLAAFKDKFYNILVDEEES